MAYSKKKSGTKQDDALATMRRRYAVADALWASKFEDCVDDVRFGFEPGAQWDKDMATKRGSRPKYEFNKTRPAVKQVTNDMRQNNPQIKVRASEDSQRDLAEVMNGLIRNIEAQSQAETAYDTAGFFAATGGYGVFRYATEYSNDDMFEQDIRVVEVRNPFSVKFGPAKKFDKRDARYLFVEDSLEIEEFKELYPDAQGVDFSGGDRAIESYGDWFTEKRVRIAEYWKKTKASKTIYQLSDGRVIDEDDYQALLPMLGQPRTDPVTMQPLPPITLKNQRVVAYDRITVEIVSGAEVLEGPHEWAGKFFPFVPVWGESVNIEGDEIFQGIVRPIKDAQRVFNWNVCTGLEVMANQPRAPFMATPAMLEGLETAWKNMAVDNPPVLFYNVDTSAPNGGAPFRSPPPTFPGALFEGAQFASDLIKSVSNVVDAPIQSRAASGKAIQAVEHQQDVGNFDFIDNLARAKAFGGEILVDLIPKIYDTERVVMILGDDGRERYVKLNESIQNESGEWQVINDLSQGKFAVTVTVGPSFATQRMETLDMLMQMAQNPALAPVVADLIAKNMDVPGSQELEKRLRKMGIAQGLIEPGEEDGPPPPPPQPDPTIIADAQLKQAQAAKTAAEAENVQVQTMQMVNPPPVQGDGGASAQLEYLKLQQDAAEAAEKLRIEAFKAETDRMALIAEQERNAQQFQLEMVRLQRPESTATN